MQAVPLRSAASHSAMARCTAKRLCRHRLPELYKGRARPACGQSPFQTDTITEVLPCLLAGSNSSLYGSCAGHHIPISSLCRENQTQSSRTNQYLYQNDSCISRHRASFLCRLVILLWGIRRWAHPVASFLSRQHLDVEHKAPPWSWASPRKALEPGLGVGLYAVSPEGLLALQAKKLPRGRSTRGPPREPAAPGGAASKNSPASRDPRGST